MLRAEHIRSLSDFRQNASVYLDRLAEDGGVEVLTVNGQAKGVVMAPRTFDELAEKLRLAESLVMIDASMKDVKTGRTKDARKAIRDIAKQLGLKLDR